MSVDLNSVVVQGKDQVCAEVDGEVVMMSVQKGNYYGLDNVGGRVWDLIAEPRRVSEVVDALLAEYHVDQATCAADLLRFLGELENQGLIEIRAA